MATKTTPALFETDIEQRRLAVANRFERQLAWYETHARRNRVLYQVFQTATIVLGGATPILVLWTSLPKAVQALPAAAASIAAGLSGVFGWRDDWIRFAQTAEALKRERTHLQARAGPRYAREVDDEVVLANFVEAIEELAASEVGEWRARQLSLALRQDGSGGTDSRPLPSNQRTGDTVV